MITHLETIGEAIRLKTRSNKIEWNDFVYLLKSGDYSIKEDNGDSLVLSIEGEPYAEIEVSYSSKTMLHFISIQLLNYHFIEPDLADEYELEPTTLYSNLVDAISYINGIYEAIREEYR